MSRDFGYELFRVLITVGLAILLFTQVGYAGERKRMDVYDGGERAANGEILYEHYQLADVGECDEMGCVMSEGTRSEWDGKAKWVIQAIDVNGDGQCDIIVTWKPLVDPTHGTYYAIYQSKPCKGE